MSAWNCNPENSHMATLTMSVSEVNSTALPVERRACL